VAVAASAAAGLAAAWLAAGSTGLLAHPLRHALTWLALGGAVVAAWPPRAQPWPRLLAAAGGVALALVLTASPLAPVNVMAVAVALAGLAIAQQPGDGRALRAAALAAAVLGVYRLALTSVPALWLAADACGRALGRLGGALAGEPLWVGATFGGIDFLAAMAAFAAAWLAHAAPPRTPRTLYTAAAIAAAHLAYLLALALSARLLAALPEPKPEDGWTWAGALRTLIPWNLPALAAGLHATVAALLLRRAPATESTEARSSARKPGEDEARTRDEDDCRLSAANRLLSTARSFLCSRVAAMGVAAGLALLLPLLTTLCWGRAGLEGRKIVLYEKGFLNWLKPAHGEYGRLSIGMYGLLPTFLESLGARCVVSRDLSEADLRDADAVVLLYPNEPWQEGQLERLWAVARRGGALLVFGEHTVRERGGGNCFNEALAPTAMRVRFDSAMFEVGGWLQSYEPLAHPATAGVPDDRNQFGVVIGASVAARWPARPLLVGRWGWADPGDPGSGEAMMGNRRYDAGEKLGDLVLAAEQPLGKGRVIAFGDTSGMTNGITVGAHVFSSRLLAYAASGAASPQAPWRQALGLLAALGLAAALALRADPQRTAAAALILSLSLAFSAAVSRKAAEVLPDGRSQSPNNLAYLDGAHIGAESDESWRPDGTAALAMTLMRNGYLALNLPELTAERLSRAALLVSVAPSKAFTRRERRAIHGFVEQGGIFICTVGCGDDAGSRALLAEFGLHVGSARAASGRSADAPAPLGHFKSPYVNPGQQYMCHVRFHAAWPVEASLSGAQPIAYGPKDTTVICLRRVGRGKVVLIGDTCFAMNKNLENEDGSPFEGMRENADFWRWFLSYLTDRPAWIPPKQEPVRPPTPPVEGATP